jgi:hypothetical protein
MAIAFSDLLFDAILDQYRKDGMSMPYTIEDFVHDYTQQFLQKLTVEQRLQGLSVEQRMKGLSAEERLEGLTQEKRVELLKVLLRSREKINWSN